MLNDDTFLKEWEDLKHQGLARSLVSDHPAHIVNLSSNDYLGLSSDPFVLEAAHSALSKWGTGGTASRLMAGTRELHQQLEIQLASFLGKEAALVFSSGYHANTGILPALTGPDDLILFDRLCHASIIDGIRLSRATFFAFDHNDLNDLEKNLKKRAGGRRHIWVVTEGFFSMDGDAPPLPELIALIKPYNAFLYLDEAHSFGVVGREGRGWADQKNVLEQVDLFIGTLSKSLASQGGFVAAKKIFVDLLISKSRSFKYTTALAPACAGAALAALARFPQMDDRRKNILHEADQLRIALHKLGFNTLKSISPIIPVWTGGIDETRILSEHLFQRGFFVPSIRPPTVPVGEGRVRISITHEVAKSQVREEICNAFLTTSKRGDLSVQKN